MIKKILLCLIIFCIYLTSQANKFDSLDVLNLNNECFIKILDDIIIHERNCDYYDSSLIFTVNIQSFESLYQVQIGAIGFNLLETGNEIGCFVHQGHLFIVSGNYFLKSIFTKTNKRKLINYYETKESYDPETGEVFLDIIDDDSFSFWTYQFKRDKFYLLESHTFCN